MLVLGAFVLSIGGSSLGLNRASAPPDTVPADTVAIARPVVSPTGALTADDTIKKRAKAVELSDWYGRRLTIHRYVAYGTIPVFAAQWAAGMRLYNDSKEAPTWAKTTHRVGATMLAGMFTVNTVTGLWNLWDTRSQREGRALRTAHAIMMLAADGAFTYAGAKLSEEAETNADKRREHRTIALSAMGLTVASGAMMKIFNR